MNIAEMYRQLRQAVPFDQLVNSRGMWASMNNPERSPFVKTNPEASLDGLANEIQAFMNAPDDSPMGMFIHEGSNTLPNMPDDDMLSKFYRELTTKGLQNIRF